VVSGSSEYMIDTMKRHSPRKSRTIRIYLPAASSLEKCRLCPGSKSPDYLDGFDSLDGISDSNNGERQPFCYHSASCLIRFLISDGVLRLLDVDDILQSGGSEC